MSGKEAKGRRNWDVGLEKSGLGIAAVFEVSSWNSK